MIFDTPNKNFNKDKRTIKRFAFIPTQLCDSFLELHGWSLKKMKTYVWLEWYIEEQKWNSIHPTLFGTGAWFTEKRYRPNK